jgi:hypothetical protein
MSKLYIFTQDQENYGDEANPHWKMKGGEDFFVPNFSGDETTAVMALRSQIEEDNPYFRRQIIGWNIVANDYMTDFEQSQLEYEGTITYPAKILELA